MIYLCWLFFKQRSIIKPNLIFSFKVMKLKLLIVALFCSLASWGQVTIVSDGLNNSTTLFTLTNGAYYTGNSAAGDRPASSPFASEGTHSRGITNGTATLLSNDINTIGYTSITMSFKLASFSIGSTGNGADGTDIVTVEVSPDGGTTWYSTVRVLGNSNANWAYSATGNANTTYDGNVTPVNFQPAGGGNRTTDGFSNVQITGLPSIANLRFKITLFNNDGAERWILDDFKVEGILLTCSTPIIGTNPSTTIQNLCVGASATALTVAATGSPTLTYQWYSNSVNSNSGGTLIAGATSSSYTPSTATAGTLYYYCKVGSTCLPTPTPAVSAVSGAVNVNAVPATPTGTINVSANPSCGPATLTYSAPNANIYWQTTAGGTLTGSPTTSSYTSSAAAGSYTVYVRELSGTCWSPAISVNFTVTAPVNITGQPTNQSATTGNTATFSVTASNAAGYQWQINTGSGWSDIAGATTASYTTPATTLAMNGYQYQVVITGNAPCGNVTSASAILSVTTGPCFTEDFASIGAGNSTSTAGSSTAWTGNANFPTVNTAYQAGGAVRIGSGTNPGSITSSALASVSGNVTVSVSVKGWTTVEGVLS